LELISKDKEIVEKYYQEFLVDLSNFFKENNIVDFIEVSKVLIKLLHCGKFSMNGTNHCDNTYDYLYLSNLISEGALVMYGVCCCRHASTLGYDVFNLLGYDVSFKYIKICSNGDWKRVSMHEANHCVVRGIYSDREFYVDLINKLILEIFLDRSFEVLDVNFSNDLTTYSDSRVKEVGKVLSKYYNLKRMGIYHLYEYD